MKTCSSCNENKPTSEFQVRKASRDGLTAACKDCLKNRDAKRYSREKHRRAERHKEYMKTSAGKDAHKKASEAWRDRNRVRRAAHTILGNAVRSGRVTPLPCFCCGEKAEAHHPDYSTPLAVVWLCPAHHKETHALGNSLKESLL